jgi:hypothetical protein
MLMPVVLREDGFVFVVYANDHRPPHVHVTYAGGEVVVLLGQGAEPPRVRDVARMKAPDVARTYRMVEKNRATLLERWRRIHGD